MWDDDHSTKFVVTQYITKAMLGWRRWHIEEVYLVTSVPASQGIDFDFLDLN